MIEARIMDYAYENLSEDQQNHLKEMCFRYSLQNGYNHEYSYHWIWFTPEAWLLLNLTDPNIRLMMGPVYE